MPPIKYSLLLLLLGYGLLSCHSSSAESTNEQSTTGDCSERILAADSELGGIRNHACEDQSLAQTIREYSRGMAELDYGGCTEAFAEAFDGHRRAWLATLPIVARYDSLRGEMHDLFDQIEQGPDSTEFKNLVAEIWATWSEVEESTDQGM